MKRQKTTTVDGTNLERQYIYLPRMIWQLLQQQARTTNTSVSQLIEHFANSGTANSKESNDRASQPTPRT